MGVFTLWLSILALAAQNEKEVVFNNTEGGKFAQAYASRSDLQKITLSGPLNEADLKLIANQYNLESLNLRDASILSGKVGMHSHQDNEFSGFLGYAPIQELVLPKTLKKILPKAFARNSAMLKSLYITSNEPLVCSEDVFKDYSYQNCTLYVPKNQLEQYKSTTPWSLFVSIKADPQSSSEAPLPAYHFMEESYTMQAGESVDLTFNKPLPEDAVLAIEDAHIAILKGEKVYADLIGITYVTLTVGKETSKAQIIVNPAISEWIDPYINWNMTREEILERIGSHPHKDTENPALGYDAIDFDFGNMGQKYVRYSFLKSTGKLESVIIAFVSPIDYKDRKVDSYFTERFHLKQVKEGLSKIFERGDVTVETFITSSLAMASYKPTPKLEADNTHRWQIESKKPLKSTIDLFAESSEPFAVDRGDGVLRVYPAGSYGFGSLKAIPLETIEKTITVYGSGFTKVGIQNAELTAIHFPEKNALKFLHVGGNLLTQLDLKNCPELEHLVCANNLLTALDAQPAPRLKYLSAYLNFSKTLNIKGLKDLEILYVNQNRLNEIDASSSPKLQQLWADDNGLGKLTLTESYNDLRALFLRNCRMAIPDIEAILKKLPSVTHEEITPENEVWMRRVKVERTPNIEKLHTAEAELKGWIFDIEGIDKGIDTPAPSVLRVFPTYVQNELTIVCEILGEQTYEVVAMDGSVVSRFATNLPMYKVDLSHLPEGRYLLRSVENNAVVPFFKE